MSKEIEYQGIVTAVHSGILQVEILDETTCDACSAQKSCCMSGKREKRMDIPFTSGGYSCGDRVVVTGKTSMGLKAVLFAFVLPLILILLTLSIVSSMGTDERQAALFCLSAMLVYFLGIYFFKNKIKQTFKFAIYSK